MRTTKQILQKVRDDGRDHLTQDELREFNAAQEMEADVASLHGLSRHGARVWIEWMQRGAE